MGIRIPNLIRKLMGICQSKEVRRQLMDSDIIDRKLQQEKEKELTTVKLLLLGAGQSGKSTILKQMTIIHNKGFSEGQIQEAKGLIYANTVKSMATILNAMKELKISFDNPENEIQMGIILTIFEFDVDCFPWTQMVYNALKQLWSDKGVKSCYERRNEYQLNDSANYFFDALDRIHMKGYKPTEQDILYIQVPTSGIRDISFTIRKHIYRVYDVGGQRTERRKWIHYFEKVHGVVFIVALSEYNLTLFEDNKTNRIIESTLLFSVICNSRWFEKSSMVLFLNKKDLFETKIDKGISINIAFPKYEGPTAYRDSVEYIKKVFLGKNENKERKNIYLHETCATDTNQVEKVIESVIDYVTQRNIRKTGFD